MAVAFQPGMVLSRGDLEIYTTNSGGYASNCYEITYGIYYVDPSSTEVLIGDSARTPVNPTVGEYYASIMIPPSATVGTYRIRWTFREFAGAPQAQVVMEFAVVSTSTVISSPYNAQEQAMIQSLRILLRDNNPGRNYSFRPPEYEGNIGQYNQVFGQVWEDAELFEYLQRGLDWCNMLPPRTDGLNTLHKLVQEKPSWRTAVLWAAITHACFALASCWTVNEFNYSIGGVSLDLEKSSKYESLKQNAEGQLDKFAEAKLTTVRYTRGLQQPKYGIGVRSAFGSQTGKGVLSPRNFL